MRCAKLCWWNNSRGLIVTILQILGINKRIIIIIITSQIFKVVLNLHIIHIACHLWLQNWNPSPACLWNSQQLYKYTNIILHRLQRKMKPPKVGRITRKKCVLPGSCYPCFMRTIFHRKIFIYIDLRPYLSTKIIFANNSWNFTHIFSAHISRHLYFAKHCILEQKTVYFKTFVCKTLYISRYLYCKTLYIWNKTFQECATTLSWQIASNFTTLNAFFICFACLDCFACFDCFAFLCITWSSFFVFFFFVGG